MTQHQPLTFGLQEIFGPSSGTPAAAADGRGAIVTRSCDVASIHRLDRVGAFTLQTLPNLGPDDLGVHILLPEEGRFTIEQAARRATAGDGDVALLSNLTPYRVAWEGHDATIISLPGWWVYRNLVEGSQFRSDPILPSSHYSSLALRQIIRTMRDLPLSQSESAGALRTFVGILRIAFEPEPGEIAWASFPSDRFGRIFQYISQRLDAGEVSPQGAATALRCSLRTVHKACAQHGTSFNNVVLHMRLSRATYELLATTRRISDIAFASGFGSLSHFCRLFKLRMGESASDYRSRHRID